MARIQSNVGNSKFEIPANAKRMIVEDETQFIRPDTRSETRSERLARVNQLNPSDIPIGRQVDPAVAAGLRRQAQEQSEQIEQRAVHDARRRIELITGLGRKTREVQVQTPSGVVMFTLRSLKTFEQTYLSQVIESAARVTFPDGTVGFTPTAMQKIRLEALGHSLSVIDGQLIDIVLGTANLEYEDQVQARKDLIAEMDSALVNHLFSNYEILSQEVFDGYIPKNPEEAKEAAEAIKKSSTDA